MCHTDSALTSVESDLNCCNGMASSLPDDEIPLGIRSTLLVDKHAEYIKSFTKLWETTDKIEFVATGEGRGGH